MVLTQNISCISTAGSNAIHLDKNQTNTSLRLISYAVEIVTGANKF